MKSPDQILLEQAYLKINEESSLEMENETIRSVRQGLTLQASHLESLFVKAKESNNYKMAASLGKALRLVDEARRELFELQK